MNYQCIFGKNAEVVDFLYSIRVEVPAHTDPQIVSLLRPSNSHRIMKGKLSSAAGCFRAGAGYDVWPLE